MARILALALGLACAAARADYTVVVDMSQPDELTVSLKLPKAEGAPHRLDVRGAAWGLHPQVHSAMCGATPLKQQKNGTWLAEPGCREVTWKVAPVVALDGSIDASKQATLLFANSRWLLLAEATSLLRLVDDVSGAASSITIRSAERSWRVPLANDAPEFFVVGDVPARTRSVGAFEVRYVADNVNRVDALGLEALHEKALEYLVGVLAPVPGQSSERTLLVVWIGIDERRGRAGGVAGSRSFVANYVIGKPDQARSSAARTVMAVARAQFQQIAGRSPARLNQSLAAYYGLKALLKASSGPEAESIRSEPKDPGVAFWSAVDEALRAQSAGATDLDALVPDLVRQEKPEALLARLRARLGAQADALLAKYAGGRT